jgi:hypothetical protein
MSETTTIYDGTRWPWRLTVTYADGTVREDDYASDFDPAGFARHLSQKPDVTKVEVTTVFARGKQVSPASSTPDETTGEKR